MRKNKIVKVILLIIILFGMAWFTLPGSFAIFKESLRTIIYLNIEDPTGFIITFNPQNGSSNTQIVRDYGEKIGPLDYPTKSGEIFDGWYTAPAGGTKVSGNTLATGTTTYYAHYNPIICRPASTLHTASNHTYGIIPNSTHLAVGFAYDCDVDGDGTFSASDERFYYLTDDENGNSLFIYSNNVHEGSPMCGADGVLYNTDRLNNLPPTNAYLELPTTTQWSNVSLHNQPRQITTETGGTTTSKGSTTTFTYTNRAARFVTTQELDRACGLDIANGTNNYSSACFFLKENTNIEVSSCRSNWWTETPKSSGGNYIYRIDKNGTVASVDVTPTDKGFSAVRPLIEVPKESVVLYGNPKTFNVAFDSQGGSAVASYDILEGDEIGELTEPTRHSYTFSGWYTEPTGGTLVGEHTVPTGDVTYYAHWTLIPSYTVHFDAQGGSAVADKPVAHDSAVGELPTTTKAGLVFAGWYTQGGTLVTEATIIDAEVTFYAHWDSYLCKRAKAGELHTAECEQTGGNGCIRDYSNGDTITYGNTSVTAGTLNYGDAFDCDVNNDGVYDSVTERFYYVGSNGNNSSLIYYANIANDGTTITVPSQSNYAYDSSGENYHGPATGYTVLPGTTQWSNPNLNLPGTRFVTNNAGGTTTDSGTNTIDGLTYTGKAARLLTSQELATACGAGTPTNTGYLDNCNYLMENIGLYETTTGNSGYWLENPSASTEDTALTVLGVSGKIADDDVTVSNAYGIRPVIDLPTKYINKDLRTVETYTIEFDSRGGSDISDKTITEGTALGALSTPIYDGYVFEGWFTEITNGTEVTSETVPTYSTKYYAHWTPLVCRRADPETLHTETCGRSSGGCVIDGYTNGATITYGNSVMVSGTLAPGDAFDCDVDNDGVYDPVDERFYYVSPKYIGSTDSFDNTKAVLIYYSDVKNGVSNETQTVKYDTNNQNWNGPISGISHLPSTTQWDNPLLEGNETRNIRNQLGGTTTKNGSNTIVDNFTYTDKAARFLTYQEVVNACGNGAESQSGSHGIKKMATGCNYLMERVPAYLTSVTLYGYWLETPYSVNAEAERISGGDVAIEPRGTNGGNNYLSRPAITIPVKYIEKTADGRIPTVTLTEKTGMVYTGSAQVANTATVTLVGNDTFSGTITYTYYTDSSCTTGATTTAPTNAGEYYVRATTSAFGNYDVGASECVAHTIAKTTPTVSLTEKTNMVYTGASQSSNTATVTLVNNEIYSGDINYTYYTDSSCTIQYRPMICSRVTDSSELHMETCTRVNDYGCRAAGYYDEGSKGTATVVYGNIKTTEALQPGDALDCDVNGNGIIDKENGVSTERFYYISSSYDLDTNTFDSTKAALLYYANTSNDGTTLSRDFYSAYPYATQTDINALGYSVQSADNYHGPATLYKELPNTTQWSNSQILHPGTRQIVNGDGVSTVNNGNTNIESFTYTNKAARLLTYQEVVETTGTNILSDNGQIFNQPLDNYIYLLESLWFSKYETNGIRGYWIETPRANSKTNVFYVNYDRYVGEANITVGYNESTPARGARPVIDVLKTNISSGSTQNQTPANGGTYYVKASIETSGNYDAGESLCVAHTIGKSNTTTSLSAIANSYTGSPVPASGATSTLSSNSSAITDGVYTYTYYEGASCDGVALANAPTNPGTYRVKATLIATDNYNSSISSCTAYTINQVSLTVSLTPKANMVYDGTAKTPNEATVTLSNNETYTGEINYNYYTDNACTVPYTGTPICKRVTDSSKLHTETCTNSDTENYCQGDGYASGATITYGNVRVGSTFTTGDAFNCDVNGDGTYDDTTERFYYVSDYYDTNTQSFDSSTAVLIYYKNFVNGVASESGAAYDLSNENWHGPVTALTNLPSTTGANAWRNDLLKTSTRKILACLNENCSSVSGSTSGGDLPTAFSYEGSAGRLITGKEIFSGCYNGSALINTGSLSDKCKFLFEGTKYADSSKTTYGSWLESPPTSVSSSVWVVGVSYRYLRNVVSTDIARGVRPVIDVPKFKIDTSIIPSDAGSYYVKASVGSSNNYLAGESSCVAHTIAKSDTTTTLNAITNTYNGSAQAATGAVSTLNSNSSIISSGSYTYTYYSGNSCDGIALAGAPTNPGEYRVKATLTATDNYNSSTSSCIAYTMNDTSATITINKDGFLWNNNGMQVALYQNGTEAYPYNSGVVSGNTITFSTILPGTYDLYVSRDENNVNTLVDSGVDAVVTTTESAIINYYTLSMTTTHATLSLNSDSFTSGDSVVVLGNIEHTISVTPENNYMLSTWSKTSGTVTFDNATSATTTVVVSAASEIEAVTTERTKQRVTFDNDGVETYVDVDLDESLGDDMPEDPTKSGYIFVGWFIDGDITKPFDKDTQVSGDLDVVAVWTEDTNMARIGNQYFTTLNLAVQAVPTTGVETEIIILKDATVSGRPQSSANQNIKLIGGNHTLTCGDNNILYNYGTLTIVDGTYISGVSGKGVFDTVGGSHTYIIGGTISNTNDRAAVYNAGYLEISGDAHLTSVASDRPVIHNYQTTSEVVVKGGLIEQTNASCKRGAIQNEKSTGKVTVTGGTIKSSSTNSAAGGIQMGAGTLVIGTQNGTHDSTSPVIMGVKYGVNSSVNYSFYDGIIKGVTAAVNDDTKITNKESGHSKVTGTETIGSDTYHTLTYAPLGVYTINLDANGGTIEEDHVDVVVGNSITSQSGLPTPEKGVYTFDGWYTSKTTQDNSTRVTYPITPSAAGSTTYYAKWSYTASNTPVLFNTTNDVMQVYYDNIDTWSANKSTFETDMMENFTDHNCSACDQPNSCKNPLAGEYCERPKGYETGVSSINVYPYDVTNQQVGNTPVSYITTVDGTIYNMIPGESYYWESTEDSNIHGIVTAEADDNRRTIYTTVRNVRDLGGMTAVNDTISGTLKYEKLYRGAELHTGTDGDNDVASLTKLGITREIDLRADSEGKNKGQKYLTVYDITASNNPNLYIPADNAATEDVVITNYSINPVATEFITAAHPNEYAAFKKYMKAIMRYIAYGDDSIYFHCTIGSDRTGTMAYFLEGLLGVSLEDRLRDYELSYFFGMTNRHRFHDYLSGSQINPRFESMYKSYDTYQKIYDFYTYGDTAAEIEEADQLLRDFRIAMIDGVIPSKTATVSLVPKSNMVYDGTEKAANTATVTLESPDVYEGTINYTYYTDSSCTTGATTTAPTNAGSYYVKASIAAFGDYSAAESSCVAHIVAKSDTITSLTAITNTYNGSAQTVTGATSILSNSNAITNGTYTYTYYEGTSCDGTALANAPTNAGDYRVKATLAGTYNYNSSTSSCTIFTINKSTPTVSLTSKTASYTGSEVPANAATVTLVNNETYNGIVDYTYYTDSSCTTGATTTAPTNVGSYYVKASIAASGNYSAAESSCVAHTIASSVPQPVCKRATSLHTATCSRTDSYGCRGNNKYANGAIITYGNLGTGESLTPGDAFDCDVNNDGTWDSATERFYYVADEGSKAVLIYYANVTNGAGPVQTNYAYYASANQNWHGPQTAVAQLPSLTQWSNSQIEAPGTRQITAETGATSTSGGTIEIFTYTDKAARLLTTQELVAGCSSLSRVGSYTDGELEGCNYLMENIGQYEGTSESYGYWLESPRASYSSLVWSVDSNSRYVSTGSANYASSYGVRPVITVLKSNISY